VVCFGKKSKKGKGKRQEGKGQVKGKGKGHVAVLNVWCGNSEEQ
jgi:hypothetical protein